MIRRPYLSLLAILTCAAPVASQLSTTLTPDRDNTLFEDPTGSLSSGSGERLFIGRNSSGLERRALLRFDVAGALPAGSTITSAELRLEVTSSPSGATPVLISTNRVLADWGEGASVSRGGGGAPAAAGDATWIHTFFAGSTWQRPGGDFASVASGSGSAPTFGSFTISSTPAAVRDVQSWLDDSATNYGWLLLGGQGASGNARSLAARESSNTTIRPQLVIRYDAPTAQVTTFGQTCRSAFSPPISLTADGLPTLGNANFGLRSLMRDAVNQRISIGTARLTTPISLFGCDFWMPASSLVAAIPVRIFGEAPLPVPNDPALIGGVLYGQAFALNAFSALPSFSSAIEVRIGT